MVSVANGPIAGYEASENSGEKRCNGGSLRGEQRVVSRTNIKVLAANAVAAMVISSAALNTAGVVAALTAYIAVSGSTIIVPVIAQILVEDRVERMLGSVRRWAQRHQNRILSLASLARRRRLGTSNCVAP